MLRRASGGVVGDRVLILDEFALILVARRHRVLDGWRLRRVAMAKVRLVPVEDARRLLVFIEEGGKNLASRRAPNDVVDHTRRLCRPGRVLADEAARQLRREFHLEELHFDWHIARRRNCDREALRLGVVAKRCDAG